MKEILWPKLPAKLVEIAENIRSAGGKAYLVGGWVRDVLMQNPQTSRDFDVEVYHLTPDQLLKILSRFGKPNTVGRAFGVIIMNLNGFQADFAFPRTEKKTESGHKGFQVDTDSSLDYPTASSRRDFTINSIGLQIPENIILDPHGGIDDIENKLLRHISPAFGEDPLRALRAVQFAGRFGFEIHPETQKVCEAQDLSELSIERIWEEFRKLMVKSILPRKGLEYLYAMRLTRFFPQLEFSPRSLTLNATEYELNKELMLDSFDYFNDQYYDNDDDKFCGAFAVMAFYLGEEPSLKFFNRITRETRWIRRVLAVAEEARVIMNSDQDPSALKYQLRKSALRVSLPLLFRVIATLSRGINREWNWSFAEQLAREGGVWSAALPPLIKGADLAALGVKPGPAMGRILDEIYDLQLRDVVLSYEEAVNRVKELLPPV